jgi:exopolysaccharide production protein ExoY
VKDLYHLLASKTLHGRGHGLSDIREHDALPVSVPHVAARHGLDLGSFYLRFGKRAFDLFLVIMALPFVLPLMAVLALLTALDGATPIFRHERVGMGSRRFMCLKFRTMRPDSATVLATLLTNDPQAAAEWARDRKLSNDPRITTVGRWLRRTSLDELPQLINVLRGEMSLVGPRPITADELDRYAGNRQKYVSVRPGLTGHWQVHGRGIVGYEERIRMDVRYVQTVSLRSDLWLLLQTILVVVRLRGQ